MLAYYNPQNFVVMKKVSFNVQKWGVRAMLAVGALLGLSACSHTKQVINEDNNDMPQIHNLKYGPLVENRHDVVIRKYVDENGEVRYDTISSKPKPELKPIILEDE